MVSTGDVPVSQLEKGTTDYDLAALHPSRGTETTTKDHLAQVQDTILDLECHFDFGVALQSSPDKLPTKGLSKTPDSLSTRSTTNDITLDPSDLTVIIYSTTLWILTLYIVKVVTDSIKKEAAQEQPRKTKSSLNTLTKGTQTKTPKGKSRAS